jgi:hypothetical protein
MLDYAYGKYTQADIINQDALSIMNAVITEVKTQLKEQENDTQANNTGKLIQD